MAGYQRFFLLGLLVIAFSILFQTIWSDKSESLGTVLIAIGGFLFIVAMARKQTEKEDQQSGE